MKDSSVAVIIPVYNEEEVIAEVVTNVGHRFNNIICIDDGSYDESVKKISDTNATLIKHPINLGQGAALQTGIDYALQDPRVKFLVTYDADGQHLLSDVENMLKVIRKTKVDVILGSRFLGEAQNISWLKQSILKLAVVFSNKTSGLHLTDAHNGLRVFSRDAASQMKITMSDFSHASEIIERIAKNKLTYMEIPVTILYTDYSMKKGQSIMNAVNIGFDMLLSKVTRK